MTDLMTKAVMEEVMKTYFTKDKIAQMADKLGPEIEKGIMASVITLIKGGALDDCITDAIYDSNINKLVSAVIKNLVAKAAK